MHSHLPNEWAYVDGCKHNTVNTHLSEIDSKLYTNFDFVKIS